MMTEIDGFIIDNDSKAEWALKKIKEATDERDRLAELIEAERARLDERKAEIDKQLESDTSYLMHLLEQYMQTVKCKETKTQRTYQLLSGKLVTKNGGIEYKRDDDALLELAKVNFPELIKTKQSVDWAELKKSLIVCDDGSVCTLNGDIVECIRAEQKPDVFGIKW